MNAFLLVSASSLLSSNYFGISPGLSSKPGGGGGVELFPNPGGGVSFIMVSIRPRPFPWRPGPFWVIETLKLPVAELGVVAPMDWFGVDAKRWALGDDASSKESVPPLLSELLDFLRCWVELAGELRGWPEFGVRGGAWYFGVNGVVSFSFEL